MYLLTYRRRIPSKFFGANLPFTTNLCCPSRDPLVPNSASKKAMTWSGCRCILKDCIEEHSQNGSIYNVNTSLIICRQIKHGERHTAIKEI